MVSNRSLICHNFPPSLQVDIFNNDMSCAYPEFDKMATTKIR